MKDHDIQQALITVCTKDKHLTGLLVFAFKFWGMLVLSFVCYISFFPFSCSSYTCVNSGYNMVQQYLYSCWLVSGSCFIVCFLFSFVLKQVVEVLGV